MGHGFNATVSQWELPPWNISGEQVKHSEHVTNDAESIATNWCFIIQITVSGCFILIITERQTKVFLQQAAFAVVTGID